jgi:crotonobetainyl-CoA:carnitine CoA-transferase CaiB-like acyl-CoA transferase
VVDYATGTMGAFAIATALFQRERTGSGQHIDLSMLDVALVLSGSHIAAHGWNGAHPEPHGNSFPFATIGCYQAQDAPLMISASNLRQQRQLWTALGRPEMIKRNNNQRLDAYAAEAAALAGIIATRTADEWETFLQANRAPAARVRRMEEALADPQIAARAVIHRHDPAPGLDGPLTVPVAAFRLRHGGPSVETAPRQVGADTDTLLREIGYGEQDIAALRAAGDI